MQVEDKCELHDLIWYDLVDDLFLYRNDAELVPQFGNLRSLSGDIIEIGSECGLVDLSFNVNNLPQCDECEQQEK